MTVPRDRHYAVIRRLVLGGLVAQVALIGALAYVFEAGRSADRAQRQEALARAFSADRLSVVARRASCRRGNLVTLRNAEGWERAHVRAKENASVVTGADRAVDLASAVFYRLLARDLLRRVVRCDLEHPFPASGARPRDVTDWAFIRTHRLLVP